MNPEEFDRLVDEAWDGLPEEFRARLSNVEIVIDEWPDAETLRQAHIRHPAELLGFYHGIPLTERGSGYQMVAPDKISLYRRPIMMHCHTVDELRAEIAHVLRHEIAHHFGISDERLRDIGAY